MCYSDAIVTFSKNGKTLKPAKTIKDGNIIVLHKVKLHDSGVYICHGWRHNKDFEVRSQLLVGGI